jgi:hypothetical protein
LCVNGKFGELFTYDFTQEIGMFAKYEARHLIVDRRFFGHLLIVHARAGADPFQDALLPVGHWQRLGSILRYYYTVPLG